MPIYRLVSKADAATPEAAAEFIRQDTGGQVQHASALAGCRCGGLLARSSFLYRRKSFDAVSGRRRVSK